MVTIRAYIIFALLVCWVGTPATGKLKFPTNAFSIDPLESKPSKVPHTALMMFLTPTDAFAPSVNIQIQPHSGTIREYVRLSLNQFKSMGMKLIAQQLLGKNRAMFEYTGVAEGRELHWYAHAVKRGSNVYLVTATATKPQWPRIKEKLIRNVNSFKLHVAD